MEYLQIVLVQPNLGILHFFSTVCTYKFMYCPVLLSYVQYNVFSRYVSVSVGVCIL